MWCLLCTKYYLSKQVKWDELGQWLWHVWGEDKLVQTAGGENFEGRKPLGRLRMGVSLILQCILKEIGREGMEWIRLATDGTCGLLVGTVMNLQVAWNVGNFLANWDMCSFSRRTVLIGVSEWVSLLCTHVPTSVTYLLSQTVCLAHWKCMLWGHGVVMFLQCLVRWRLPCGNDKPDTHNLPVWAFNKFCYTYGRPCNISSSSSSDGSADHYIHWLYCFSCVPPVSHCHIPVI